MPPAPHEYHGAGRDRGVPAGQRRLAGRTAAAAWCPTRANGQPAYGCWLAEPPEATGRPAGIIVLTIGGDRISGMTRFLDDRVLDRFGLCPPHVTPPGEPAVTVRRIPYMRRLLGRLHGPYRRISGLSITTTFRRTRTDKTTRAEEKHDPATPATRRRWRRVLAGVATALAGVLVFLALSTPNNISRLPEGSNTAEALIRIPIEALLGIAVLLALPARARRVAAASAGWCSAC